VQLVWFLAPTVDLCIQQHAVIEAEIPAVQVKLLQGNDGVDKWTDQKLWDIVLLNVRVVVSTTQILLDALTHGFVKLDIVSLLVFDEGKFGLSPVV
jgi:ERCC4-related helicase